MCTDSSITNHNSLWLNPPMDLHCPGCGMPMFPDEAERYGHCFDCEKAWLTRVRTWKAGRPDKELDEAKTRGAKL